MKDVKRPFVAGVAVAVALGVVAPLIIGGKRAPAPKESTVANAPAPGDSPGQRGPRRGGGEGAQGGPRDLNVLVDDDPEGTLRLEGIVLDANDLPVADAEVTVSSNPPRTVKSGEDGTFVFDKLVARVYTLVARAEVGVAGPVTARLTERSDPVTLRLVPAASVEVTVVTAGDRKPVRGATVELRDLQTVSGTTGDDGKVTFTAVWPGGYSLVAWAPGYARSYAWIGVPRPSAGAPVVDKETIELRRGAPVAGRVRTTDGRPVEGALVAFGAVSEWAAQADPRRDAVKTDAQGRFRFDALPAGTFRFAARHPDHAPGTSAPVTLDGERERTDVEITLDAGAIVAGKVVNKQGQPVAWASVRVVAKIEGWSFEDARQVYSDEAGAFEVKGLPRRTLQAVALHESGASETVEIDLGSVAEKRDVVLTLDLDGTIAGVVVDSKGEPIAEAQVWAFPDFRRGNAMRGEWRLRGGIQELTDAGGRFVIRGLRPGDYMLRASRPGASSRSGWLRQPVEASVGAKDVKIVLENDGAVKGKVLYADGSAPEIFTISLGMGGGTPFSSSDGGFQLDDVPPGERTITVTGPGFDRKQVQVTVESDKVADVGTITVTKGRTISGRVLTPSGQPVPGAEVIAARRLFGDGAKASERGGWGPAGMGGAKKALADEQGVYTLYGVGGRDLAIVAQHETIGRSPLQLVPGSAQPVQLDLVLLPFAALEGVVRKGGKPAEGLGVNVTSQTVPTSNFMVQTGPDGAFRFDRLAPDTYLVQAITGQNPMTGIGMHTQVVALEGGQTGRVTIDIPAGVTLRAVPKPTNADEANLAMMRVVGGPKLTATNARALDLEVAARGAVYSNFAVSFRGRGAKWDDVPPGEYSVCAVPFPNELMGMAPVMEYMEREGDNLPVYCTSYTVTQAAEQTVTIEVQVPAFVPPPPNQG